MSGHSGSCCGVEQRYDPDKAYTNYYLKNIAPNRSCMLFRTDSSLVEPIINDGYFQRYPRARIVTAGGTAWFANHAHASNMKPRERAEGYTLLGSRSSSTIKDVYSISLLTFGLPGAKARVAYKDEAIAEIVVPANWQTVWASAVNDGFVFPIGWTSYHTGRSLKLGLRGQSHPIHLIRLQSGQVTQELLNG